MPRAIGTGLKADSHPSSASRRIRSSPPSRQPHRRNIDGPTRHSRATGRTSPRPGHCVYSPPIIWAAHIELGVCGRHHGSMEEYPTNLACPTRGRRRSPGRRPKDGTFYTHVAVPEDLHRQPTQAHVGGFTARGPTASGGHSSPVSLGPAGRHGDEGIWQRTQAAESPDGLRFDAKGAVTDSLYLRVFPYRGYLYGLGAVESLTGTEPARLSRSASPGESFTPGPSPFRDGCEHASVTSVWSDVASGSMYSSRQSGTERVLLSTMDLNPDWKSWRATAPVRCWRQQRITNVSTSRTSAPAMATPLVQSGRSAIPSCFRKAASCSCSIQFAVNPASPARNSPSADRNPGAQHASSSESSPGPFGAVTMIAFVAGGSAQVPQAPAPRPYADIVTKHATTDDGVFKVHRTASQLCTDPEVRVEQGLSVEHTDQESVGQRLVRPTGRQPCRSVDLERRPGVAARHQSQPHCGPIHADRASG